MILVFQVTSFFTAVQKKDETIEHAYKHHSDELNCCQINKEINAMLHKKTCGRELAGNYMAKESFYPHSDD